MAERHRRCAGDSRGAVSQWLKRGRAGGVAALKSQPRPGAAPRLTVEQRAPVPSWLARGAEAFGFRGDGWTCQRIAALIEQRFGGRSHPEHVRRLLRQAGWSVQQPVERATQRAEHALQQGWQERWPAINKKRAPKAAPSSGETSRACTCCRWRCGRGRHAGRRRCDGAS